MAAPSPPSDPPSPPDGSWAHPRPPAGAPNLRNQFSASGNGLPTVPTQPLLSSRPGNVGSLGGSAPVGRELHAVAGVAQESSSSRAQVHQAPHSARERGAGQQQRPQMPGRRAQSLDVNPEASRGVGSAGSSPPRRVKRPGRSASTEGNDAFLRVLSDASGRCLNEASLVRLEFEAGSSKRLQEVARLLRNLQSQVQNRSGLSPIAQPQEGGLDQMTAQVAFLEKKILKLREKLKRKTLEAANRTESIGRTPRKAQGSKLDLHSASIEELTAELSTLRTEKASKEPELQASASSPRTPGRMSISVRHNMPPQDGSDAQSVTALKRRVHNLQKRMNDLTSEKDAADANAEVARGLAEKVEEKLRETALTRESERIKLEAEHEMLRRRIEEQSAEISKFEDVVVNPGELDELRLRITEADNELTILRSSLPGMTSKDGGANELSGYKPTTPVKPPTPKIGPTQEDYERVLRASEEARVEGARLSVDLKDAMVADAFRIKELEEELMRVRKDGQRSEYQRRRQLADVMEQRQAHFATEAEAHDAAFQSGDSHVLIEARTRLQKSKSKFNAEISAEEAAVTTRLKDMEAQMLYVQSEMIHKLDRQKMQAHRQIDLQGRCYLALRPQVYHRDEVLQYLSFAMGLPISAFEVLEEVCLPPGTTCRGLVQATGKRVPPPQDKMDIYVRPLRDSSRPLVDPPPQDADERVRSMAKGTLASEEQPPEGSLIRLTINFIQDVKSASAASKTTGERAALVQRLCTMVASGGSLLDDMAVVSVCSLLGSTPMNDVDTAPGELVARLKRSIAGWSFLITARRTLEPLSVKLIVINPTGNEEFILYLDDVDLCKLFGSQSSLLHQPELGRELIEALLDTLHVMEMAHGKLVLVSIHAVPAPRTVLNTQCEALEDMPLGSGGEDAMAAAAHASEREALTKHLSGEPGVVSSLRELAAESQGGAITFEDVIMIEARFFVLAIHQEEATGTVHVRVQEAGNCQNFEATLPGRDFSNCEDTLSSNSRQLRVFAQSFEFHNLNLLLAAEDVTVPPGLVVRLARSDPARPHAWQDPDQRVYWLSRAGADDGHLGVAVQIDGPGTVVSEIPSRRREQLLDFVRSRYADMPAAAGQADAMEPSESMQSKPSGRTLAKWVPEYDGDREGIVLVDTSSHKELRSATAATVETHLKNASAKAVGRPVLKMGQRLPTPEGSALFVLTVHEHSEPHVHFTVGAYEIAKFRSFTTLVDSVDVFRALRMRVNFGGQDAIARRALAREIMSNCQIVDNDEGGLKLTLTKRSRSRSPLAMAISTDLADQSERSTHADVHVLGPQALSQEEVAKYMADPRRFCLLRAPRVLGGSSFELRIYDEPDAPEAAFLINNLLVAAIDTARSVVLTLRLNDKSMQHPLLPEEQYLLQPDNRTELLKRIAESIDLCTSLGQHGSVGDRLIMQSFCFDTLPPLVADVDGTLIPSPFGQPEVSRTSTQEVAKSSIEQHEETTVEALMDQDATQNRTDVHDGALNMEASPTVLYIGGCPLDEKDAAGAEAPPNTTLLASSHDTFGDVDVELSLRADHGGHAHVFSLRTVGEPEHGFEMQIPAGGDPTRIYLEYRVFQGMQLIVSMRQQAFPHEVSAIVFDIKSHEQLTLAARDDEVLPLIERSARERLCDQIEQLVRFGSLGAAGSPELYSSVPTGREIFPSDFVTRALQRKTPVVKVNIGQLAHEVPSDLVASRDLLYSCSRYVISPDLLSNSAETEATDMPDVDLDSVPLLRLSLSKKTYCQDFTFSIENARDSSGGESHMLHIRDKLTTRPLGVYGEFQKLGDLRLYMLFMEDFLPRSLRIAVVEPVSGWSFQLIILDTAAPTSPSKSSSSPDPQPYLNASPARNGLLNLFRNHLSVRRGLSTLPMLTNQHSPAEWVRSTSRHHNTPALTDATAPKLAKSLVLLRRTGFAPNNVVVLYTVSREIEANGDTFFLKAAVSQAVSTKENSVLLLTNALDRILHSCALPLSSDLTIQDFDENPARKQVAEKFLEATEVNPKLEIILCLDKLPQQLPPTETLAISAGEATADDEKNDASAAAVESLLECDEERLLGRMDRMWAVEQFYPENGGEAPPPAEGTESGDQLEPTLRVEVFDGSDCMEALFHSTNLRLRVTDLAIGRVATRDMHEEELEPWLAVAHAQHLLSASRESDLIDMLLKHASLAEPGKSPKGSGVVLSELSPNILENTRYCTSFLQSAEAETRGSVSGTVK